MHRDSRGYPYLHKYIYESLGPPVRELMQKCRLPCYNWSVGSLVGVAVEETEDNAGDTRDRTPAVAPATESPGVKSTNQECHNQSACQKHNILEPTHGKQQTSKLTDGLTSNGVREASMNAAASQHTPTSTLPLRQLPSTPLQDSAQASRVIFHEVVENKSGLSMTSAERIAFLRQKSVDMNFHGKVRETNVPAASKTIYTRATCQCRGVPTQACPYQLEMFYYLQASGPIACNMAIIHAHSDHNHDLDRQNVSTHFTPKQLGALQSYLLARPGATSKELRDHLVEKGCPFHDDIQPLQTWRKNFLARIKKQPQKIATPDTEYVEQCPVAGRLIDLVEYQKIAEWPKMHISSRHPSVCQLQIVPEPLPDANHKLFVSFATEGMGRRFAHFQGELIALLVDVKQGVCAEEGFGIATLLGGAKDVLRGTTFGTSKSGQRVQGRTYIIYGSSRCSLFERAQ